MRLQSILYDSAFGATPALIGIIEGIAAMITGVERAFVAEIALRELSGIIVE